jgi:hypothetical protein
MPELAITVVCGTVEMACVCDEVPDHPGPHLCKCGGSWSFDSDGNFRVHALPQALPAPTEDLGDVRAIGRGAR